MSADDQTKVDELDKNLIRRKAQLYEIEQSLPQKNSMYLKVSQILRSALKPHSIYIFLIDNSGKCKRQYFGKSREGKQIKSTAAEIRLIFIKGPVQR